MHISKYVDRDTWYDRGMYVGMYVCMYICTHSPCLTCTHGFTKEIPRPTHLISPSRHRVAARFDLFHLRPPRTKGMYFDPTPNMQVCGGIPLPWTRYPLPFLSFPSFPPLFLPFLKPVKKSEYPCIPSKAESSSERQEAYTRDENCTHHQNPDTKPAMQSPSASHTHPIERSKRKTPYHAHQPQISPPVPKKARYQEIKKKKKRTMETSTPPPIINHHPTQSHPDSPPQRHPHS